MEWIFILGFIVVGIFLWYLGHVCYEVFRSSYDWFLIAPREMRIQANCLAEIAIQLQMLNNKKLSHPEALKESKERIKKDLAHVGVSESEAEKRVQDMSWVGK